MPEYLPDNETDDSDEPPSKSARKRHMHSLQDMGETLVNLNDKQLARIPIDDDRLLAAPSRGQLYCLLDIPVRLPGGIDIDVAGRAGAFAAG